MVYRFGDFALDVDTRQLLLLGEKVHLTPKAFDLLHLLVANRDRAVSKSELQQRMWPSTFVEETNLASLIAEIRRALGSDSSKASPIETIYGFGYRFVDAVSETAAAAGTKLWLILEQRPIPLMSGTNVIGRAPDAAIQIDSPGMSRYHARIHVAGSNVTLEDAGSKNGTLLNGTRITTAEPLADGDEIRLGTVTLTFRTSSGTTPTETIQPEGD
jgi:DNA-binding winged helix-turn-helix (wHTH) protein